jgi:DNA-binding SARP family transcriptional activator
LLGDFRVIDDAGSDITGSFTPVITQLFLLCLLSTIKNGKGISSLELKNLLWFDKDDDSARNNRNVNINKLRVIMKNLKNLEIVNNNNYWSVVSDKDIFCDYAVVLSLLRNTASKKEQLNTLFDLAAKGNLLPNIESEWLDAYKADYSNLLIDNLFRMSERNDIKDDTVLIVRITNIILLHDCIDEDAIVKKCCTLYNSGKKGKAKQSFEKFAEDYKNILGTSYKYTFAQFRDLFLCLP